MGSKDKSEQTLKEYGRGIIGGLLFSLPIVYTMEVWWTGFIASPEKLIAFVIFTYMMLLGYNKFAGMREDATFLEVCWDSVEEIGMAFVVTFLFLLLIHRINFDMSLYEVAGKTIMEGMIVSIGISVGTAQMGSNKQKDQGMGDAKKNDEENGTGKKHYLELFLLSICGAVLVSSSVAPTDEILVIAMASSNFQLLLMTLVSLFLCSIALFFSDFHGSGQTELGSKEMLIHLIISYLTALLVAYGLLWFFGRLAGFDFQIIIAEIVVLTIPASLGASAGRLLLRGKKQ